MVQILIIGILICIIVALAVITKLMHIKYLITNIINRGLIKRIDELNKEKD